MAELKRSTPWDQGEPQPELAGERSRTVEPLRQRTERLRRINFDVPESLHKAMRRKAVEDDETIADVGRRLFEEWAGE